MELVARGSLEGVTLGTRPIAGVVWHDGHLLRLVGGTLAWSRRAPASPVLAADGRRLYVALGAWLACLDLRTGADVWAVDLPAPADALAARPGGVDVAVGSAILRLDQYGRIEEQVSLGVHISLVQEAGGALYAGGVSGVWRVDPGGRPAQLTAQPCVALFERGGALVGLTDGPGGTALLEDGGVPLVWSFPDAAGHWIIPWGAHDWAVVPRAGQAGVWVVDRRMRARWRTPLPGVARGVAVAGRAVAVLLDDDGLAIAITHPDAPAPILLVVGADAHLFGDGELLYLSHRGRTDVLLVREP